MDTRAYHAKRKAKPHMAPFQLDEEDIEERLCWLETTSLNIWKCGREEYRGGICHKPMTLHKTGHLCC